MKFTAFGVRIEIDFWFLSLITVMVLCSIDMLTLLAAIIVHETGHFLPLKAYGRRLDEIKVGIGGIKMIKDNHLQNYTQDFVILLCGPLLGIISAFAAALCGANYYAMASFGMSMFNLLPFENLDGGSMVQILKQKREC